MTLRCHTEAASAWISKTFCTLRCCSIKYYGRCLELGGENGYEGSRCDIYSVEKVRHRCCMNLDDLLYIAILQHQVLWPVHLRYFESASCMLSHILDQSLTNRKTRLEGKYLLIPKCVLDNRRWTHSNCHKGKLQWTSDMIAVNTSLDHILKF